jgi:Spy/CpxP family protein refolding chaperone
VRHRPAGSPVSLNTEVVTLSKRVFILAALALAGSWSEPVRAQVPDAAVGMVMMGDGPILVIPVLLRFADLTAQQTEQVSRIIERDRTDTQRFLGQLAEANNQLDDALLAPADGSARISGVRDSGALVQRLAQLRLQFMQSELKTVLAIRRLLTAEQLKKVNEAMNEMKKAGTSQPGPYSRAF